MKRLEEMEFCVKYWKGFYFPLLGLKNNLYYMNLNM